MNTFKELKNTILVVIWGVIIYLFISGNYVSVVDGILGTISNLVRCTPGI